MAYSKGGPKLWMFSCLVGCSPGPTTQEISSEILSGSIGTYGTTLSWLPDDQARYAGRLEYQPALVEAGLSQAWTGEKTVDVLIDGERTRMRVNRTTISALQLDHRVQKIQEIPQYRADENEGDALRHATGVAELLSAGLDGSVGSGRNPLVDRMLVAVVDAGALDANHPAWADRRVAVWDWAAPRHQRHHPL